ncbi:MAG: ATP-binding cassette domain-containing protein [Hansschlegelia sp.]
MAGSDGAILEAKGLTKVYGAKPWYGRDRRLVAVEGGSLSVGQGEAVGIVGESGSGKSTLGRMLVGLLLADGGEILLDGTAIDVGKRSSRKSLRASAQFVFQDAASAFNPRRTIAASVSAPLSGLSRAERADKLAGLLDQVGLSAAHGERKPHEVSGGQLQRAGIARALAAGPRVLVLDEPVSALDVSVQAQIIALLRDLRATRDLAMVFVSHDLAVVEALCDRVIVMRAGRIVEEGSARAVLSAPRDAYTRSLVAAARGEAA